MNLDVLTYNVKMAEGGFDGDLKERWVANLKNKRRARGILDLLVNSPDVPEYDVVVFTELFGRGPRDVLVHGPRERVCFPLVGCPRVGRRSGGLLEAGYKVSARPRNSTIKRNGGVMIASRHQVVREETYVYQDRTGWELTNQAKGIVYMAIQKGGERYHVFGTHMQSGCNDEELDTRRAQIRELGSFVARQQIPSDEPIVLAGDFNIGPQQTGDCARLTVDELLDTLNEYVPCVGEFGPPDTSGPRPFGTTLSNEWLDHLFYANVPPASGSYRRHWWFVDDGLPDYYFGGWTPDGQQVDFLSDHHPLGASFGYTSNDVRQAWLRAYRCGDSIFPGRFESIAGRLPRQRWNG